jgi:diacylglycerol O-acyltransferase / trehalose O-mycolyltransferase
VQDLGGNPDNMWGSWPGPDWAAHDPMAHAAALRGKWVYLSAGGGVPGPQDDMTPLRFVQLVPLEAAAGSSSHIFLDRLDAEGIRTAAHLTTVGIHWWDYWQQNLHESWDTTFSPAFFGTAVPPEPLSGGGSSGSGSDSGSGS